MFWGGRGKVSYIFLKKPKQNRKEENHKINQLDALSTLYCFVLKVSLLCPSLTRSDPLLEIIIQVNTWKKFFVWDRSEVVLCFVSFFFNERSFHPLLCISEICKTSLFIFEPATGGEKWCVKVRDGDCILQCISQIIKLSVRRWNFKAI